MYALAAVALIVLLTGALDPAEAIKPAQTLTQRVTASAAVVSGEVLDMNSHWSKDSAEIITSATLAVKEIAKGDLTDPTAADRCRWTTAKGGALLLETP